MPKDNERDFSHIIPAVVGALSLYREAQFVLSGKREGNISEATKIAADMAVVIALTLLAYHRIGRASDFLGLVPFPIDSGMTVVESPMIPPWMVLQAVMEGMKVLEKTASIEREGRSIFIATVGRNNSGKGVVTNYLRERYGFLAYPLSDRVREMAAAFGEEAPLNREILIDVGRTVKEVFGAGVLISAAIHLFSELGRVNKLLFDGLRVPGEAKELLAMTGDTTRVMIIGVSAGGDDFEADRHFRFERALGRGGPKDPKADSPEEFSAFCALDDREGSGIDETMEQATHTVVNSGSIQSVHDQIDAIMKEAGIVPLAENTV